MSTIALRKVKIQISEMKGTLNFVASNQWVKIANEHNMRRVPCQLKHTNNN